MTLADLIRKYFEERRKVCEQKAQSLEIGDNFQFYTDHDQDEKFLNTYNTQYFSNNIDPDKSKPNRSGPSKNIVTRQIGVSKSKKIVTLPDGTVQVETVIRDSNGNEEKYITRQKGNKQFTTVIRRDPFGVETIEEKESNVGDTDVFFGGSLPYVPSDGQKNSDSGFDFWYQKFFRPSESQSDVWKNENMPFDFNANIEEQIDKIMKGLGNGKYPDSFSEGFRNSDFWKDSDVSKKGFNFGDFSKFNDSFFNEEARRFLENAEKESAKSNQKHKKKNGTYKMHKQAEKLIKSIAPPSPKSLFEKFAEHAMVELPEEETPLDKFVEIDDEVKEELSAIGREQEAIIKKLHQAFAPNVQRNVEKKIEKDVYSDIEDPNEVELSLMLPKPEQNLASSVNDLGDIIRKTFDHTKFFNGSTQTQVLIDNGKRRIESVKKDDQGNTEKTVSYQIGNKNYEVVTVIDKYGKQIKKDRSFNFSEDQLTDFKNQWNKNFHSDFKE